MEESRDLPHNPMKQVPVRLALLLIVGSSPGSRLPRRAPTAPDPAPSDPYLWFGEIRVESWPGVEMVRGIPKVAYEGRLQANPVTIAQWGLASYSRGSRRDLLAAANWLVCQERDGSGLPIPLHSPGSGVTMRSPWISALAQGQALSVLARAWRITTTSVIALQADRRSAPSRSPSPAGG